LTYFLNMFVSDTLCWCGMSDEMFVTCACLYIYLCVIIFSAIESNEECTEEGEVYEYQDEEDQGQATQDKPSKLVAYLIPVLLIA
jgi:hypothetical protein